MSDITKVKEEILETIRKKRAEMDPALLERARDQATQVIQRRATQAQQQEKPKPEEKIVPLSERVPYDKKAASEVIKLFLSRHENAETFEKELVKRLQEENP